MLVEMVATEGEERRRASADATADGAQRDVDTAKEAATTVSGQVRSVG
jgi:hypothetical protein